MRHLRAIWRLMRRRVNRWLRPAPPVHSIAVFDPAEFSELISSGRKQDLATLARRLSEHHGKRGTKTAFRRAGQGAANPGNDRAG